MTGNNICTNSLCLYENDKDSKFCVKCGEPFTSIAPSSPPLSANATVCKHETNGGKFCVKCGQLVVAVQEPTNVLPTTEGIKSKRVPSAQNEKKKPTLPKIMLISLGALVVLLAAGYWILGKTISNKDDIISSLVQVAKSEDSVRFSEILTYSNGEETDEERAYSEYLEGIDISEMANLLAKSIKNLDASDQASLKVGLEGEGIKQFKIVKTKKIGLFPYYEIQPIKFKVFATANNSNMSIVFNNNETIMLKGEKVEIGEFLPGPYKYSISWKSDIDSILEERQFYVYPSEENELEAYLESFAIHLYNEPGLQDWTYYVNGKEVNMETDLIEERLVVPNGVKLKLSASFKEDGVVYKSNEVELSQNNTYFELEFPEYTAKVASEAEKANREEEIHYLIDRYLTIYSNGDVGLLHLVISSNSNFYKQQTQYLQSLLNKSTSAIIDDYHITSIQESGSNTYIVTVNETYTILKPDETAKEVSQKSIYTVKQIGGSYYITDLKLG